MPVVRARGADAASPLLVPLKSGTTGLVLLNLYAELPRAARGAQHVS
jgi:hypothetical protein